MKYCDNCKKKLAHNSNVGFCLSCLPEDNFVRKFNSGNTIQEISQEIFNSSHGGHRTSIRRVLIEKLGESKFQEIKRRNRAKRMKQKEVELPKEFMVSLFKQGKTSPEINKALKLKGFSVHVATVRKRLKEWKCDLQENNSKRKIERQKISKKRRRLIKELWLDGNNIHNIASALNMARNTVKTYLHQMGFKTRFPQNYILKNYNKEELEAEKYLEKKGYNVKKCYFLCQRENSIIVPKELRPFCKKCPVKELKFKHRQFYDFMIEKDGFYSVVEVKKTYISNNWERAHFTLGQFVNLPLILKNQIPFRLLIKRGGKFEEDIF